MIDIHLYSMYLSVSCPKTFGR